MKLRHLGCVLFGAIAFGQLNANLEQVKSEYDRFEDKTTVSLETQWAVPVDQLLLAYNLSYGAPKIRVVVTCSGAVDKCSGDVGGITFVIYTKHVLYGKGVPGVLLVDGTRVPLNLKWTPTLIAHREIAEMMSAPLSRDQLKLIVGAKAIEGRIGTDEFRFTEANLKALQKLKERFTLSR